MSGTATAHVRHGRISVSTRGGNFDVMLAACKRVPGGRFAREDGTAFWHYPLSLETCRALRRSFGDALHVGDDLAEWYRTTQAATQATVELGRATDATLPRVSAALPDFAAWLRGYQRAGAAWIARGYRHAGLIADKPGVGKTAETLAGLVEAGITGPVMIICPKSSVRLVWGKELRAHLPQVPAYLCRGTWRQREDTLSRFAEDMRRDPTILRIVVVVAEMLRVELGPPCLTESGAKVAGMCPRGPHHDAHHTVAKVDKKKWVPTGYWYPDLFDATLLGGGWSAVVIDESHKLLGSLTVTKGNLMGKGLKRLPARPGMRRYALSGTPFGKAGRVQGLFGTLHWLWPDENPSYWRWVGAHFEVEERVINWRSGATAKKIGNLKGLRPDASVEEEAEAWERFLESLGPRLLRRTKEEVLQDLPPKTYREVVCPMVPRQARQYRELLHTAEITTDGGPLMVNGALALLTRSRQVANGHVTLRDGKLRFTGEGGKIDRLWEALEARGILDQAVGDKIVVASAFNEFLDAIAERLQADQVPFARFDGRVRAVERDAVVERWQARALGGGAEPRVLLLNSQAGGLSITLDMADELHIMDELADPGANEQLEDRLHRASRIHKVIIFYYRTEGSLDYARAHTVEFRRRVQHLILDGSRGVDDTRALLSDAWRAAPDDEMEEDE